MVGVMESFPWARQSVVVESSSLADRHGGGLLPLCYPAKVDLNAVFQSLGRDALEDLVRRISLGALRSYKLFDQFKIRTRLNKLNAEHLRKATPKLWERLEQGDEELARDLSQAVLVSNIDFVVQVLDFLKVPHDGSGFFQKDASAEQHLTEGWQQRAWEEFRGRYPEALVKLYINHLTWETNKQAEVFVG